MRFVLALFALIFSALALPAQARTADQDVNPFADWAGVFIAGDWRAHTGVPSEAFDNGRRELAAAFQRVGLAAANVQQFSVRPNRYPDQKPLESEPGAVGGAMEDLTKRTHGGCLFFITSHGTPEGAIMGDYGVRPIELSTLIDATCGARPTVVIISACFSGIFVPALATTNRMIMTAARPDRTSFGCGENDIYTYFDQCLLETLPKVGTFDALASGAQTCVAARETEMKVGPPSEPQVYIGAQFKLLLPLLRLDRAQGPPTP